MDVEADLARALVVAALVALEADIAQQARQQRQVQLFVRGFGLVDAPALLAHQGGKLGVHVVPFAQPDGRQEILAQQGHQLALRGLVLHLFAVPAPQLQEGDELRLVVGELGVRGLGRLALLHGTVARVLHRQGRGDDQHFRQALVFARGQDHAADARVHGQLGQFVAGAGQGEGRAGARAVGVLVRGGGQFDGAQLLQQVVAVGHRAPRWRLHERELLDIVQLQRLHPQDDRGQRRAQHFRIGERGAVIEVLLVVEADADARPHPAATAGALVGRGAADRLDAQLLDLVAPRIALDARQPAVDHEADAGYGQRGFRHVGGQHDAPRIGARMEDLLLLGLRQPGVQRQHLGAGRMALAQRLGRFADFALAGQEHQHVARAVARAFVHGVHDGVDQVALLVARHALAPGLAGGRRLAFGRLFTHGTVADLDRIQAAGDFDDRRRPVFGRREVAGEALGVDGGRGDDELQVRAARQQLLEVAQQEIDVQAAFVRLVDDDGVVAAQERVALRLRQQDAVGHQLDGSVRAGAVVEAHLVAHHLAHGRIQLLGDALGHRGRRQAARLGMADHLLAAAAEFQADLGQLRGLARAGLAADDHHLVAGDGARDLLAPRADGQVFGIGHRGDGPLGTRRPGRVCHGGPGRPRAGGFRHVR